MQAFQIKASLIRSGLAASVLLLAASASYAQTVVGLTAAPTQAVLPDGQSVPMWSYTCDAASVLAKTCVPANPNAGPNWSPVVITVPYVATGTSLTINLTNNLSFPVGSSTPAATVPTSLVIVGQLGGGLGGTPTTTASPVHTEQGPTWPASGGPSGIDCTATGAVGAAIAAGTNCPPPQGPRVQSFATEVAAGATTGLTWSNLKPGTYLIESGTHPSIQGPMGLYGVLVVTTAPTSTTPLGAAYYNAAGAAVAATQYNAEIPLVLSEIDAVQNRAVDTAVNTAGFSETKVWSGQPGKCGDLSATTATAEANTCYPPAVNYDPRYYLINGVSFDKAVATRSSFPIAPAVTSGTVLVRLVNAGLRMHVPSVVGAQTGAAAPGFSLIAEDGNLLPGVPKIQSDVFLAAGKTYDVMINAFTGVLPVYDRQLSLSTNNRRDGGMQGNISSGPVAAPTPPTTYTANGETYYCVAGTTLAVTDPSKGVLANDPGANGAVLSTPNTLGSALTFDSNGTFTYTPPTATACGGSFTYLVNGVGTAAATITECDEIVHPTGCPRAAAPVAKDVQFTSNVNTRYASAPPGVLAGATDPSGLALTAVVAAGVNADGSFIATGPGDHACPTSGLNPAAPAGATCLTIPYTAKNAQGRLSNTANATVIFPQASGLDVHVLDAKNNTEITDYRWVIEEDRTFWVDPRCQVNSTDPLVRPTSCPPLPVQSLGYNFHTAYMPIVATGCVGAVSCEAGQKLLGNDTACDVGNGICRDASQKTELNPSQVYLDPAKRYYLSILPGDGVNPTLQGAGGPVEDPPGSNKFRQFKLSDCTSFAPGAGDCGHAMGGAQISGAVVALSTAASPSNRVNVFLEETPLPTSKIAVFVFADDNPLNGENDAGGAPAAAAPGLALNEPGLGGFNVEVFDQAGGLGDATGQITYDMFNQPVSNSLAGTIDPFTGADSCPITGRGDGVVGMIPTCPDLESDGVTESPLRGQAIIANLYPGLYEIFATPAADRIARGEEWLQTNTLDGGKAHEVFIKPDEPAYFQEFGPGNFHVTIGFANPKIINDRRHNSAGTGFCDPAPNGGGVNCTAKLFGRVTNARMSRTPDQRIFDSGDYAAYSFTQCYVGLGAPDDADFALAKCDADGNFEIDNIPSALAPFVQGASQGDFKITIFDQWNDIMLDGLVLPVHVSGNASDKGGNKDNPIVFPVTQWRTDLYTRTFLDVGTATGGAGDGVSQPDEPGLPLVATNIRYRDGSFGFFNNTDLNGYAGFNEVFPFVNWLVVEADTTRFKQTGEHVVYDAGGPADGNGGRTSTIGAGLANTNERVSLPTALRVPGGRYCTTADCLPSDTGIGPLSSGRVDPPQPWGATEGWQGLLGQSSFIEFGMKPFAEHETGGIKGHVIYASTRPFDDPTLLLQLSWEPGVPRVTINLYQEGTAPDGTTSLHLVDTTTTSSWDDYAQGFRLDANGSPLPAVTLPSASFDPTSGNPITVDSSGFVPNMNCPGQDPTSPFYATLQGSPQWLDASKQPLAANAQFKCYDGWSMMNQVQPAPYDGMYKFPSITATDPTTGKPSASSCHMRSTAEPWGCVPNPDTTDGFRVGTPMLPAGKYVVEVIVPPGMELVKEEDKNILLGDIYIAPITTQFAGFGNIFIMPDQAAVGAYYNKNNTLNMTTNLGASPHHEGDTGSIESFWPCVGAVRTVPDFNSLYPTAGQNAPFAGALRPLCDRKEVTLQEQTSALAKFYVFTSTHIAAHFAGVMTNDFASEFDPFSPQFGEKFAPANLPVGVRDFTGKETGRVWADQWGIYNGLNFSTYGVNPPNPTGYVPQMMIMCMNDPGPIAKTNAFGQYVNAAGTVVATADLAQQLTDPSYSPAYSDFCYETAFMPGFTAYMDTPVIPTQAFADGYNLPDAEYPDATPAIASVIGDAPGPWVSATGHTLTITALGNQVVENPNYSGPAAKTAPFNQRTITRHYGFGGTPGTVTIAGVTAVTSGWTDSTLTVTVPTIPANLNTTTGVGSTCYNGTNNNIPAGQTPPQRDTNNGQVLTTGLASYRCGELVITAANGKRSIDAITVTVAGKPPSIVTPASPSTTAFGASLPNPLQRAIDVAAPGDLIIVGPGTYRENVLMWKPVRLQGVGAASVTINADAHPVGKMDPWRRQVNCLFGLALNGVPVTSGTTNTTFDPTGLYTCPANMFLRNDRIPFEAIVGWDATGNGNLAQLLQEPTLMGAYEGAGITVLGRGVRIPNNSTDFWGLQGGAVAGAFPDGSVYLTNSNTNCTVSTTTGRDYATANFQCNPSRIDGVSIINSSQGGGAVFMHGWNHYLDVANTRISANHGTLTGGINLGNGETPPLYVNDGTICGPGVANPAPLCPPLQGTPANGAIPFGINNKVHVHHNMIIDNASVGDALFSGTPSGAGGLTISAGADDYQVDHNWIAGNLSTGDGGGMVHSGLSFRGKINNNWILFNQSTNPTLPTNGGGLGIIGASGTRSMPDGTECGTLTDFDCPPGLGDGTGPGLVIDSNLIMGNSAESGSGGGLRLQQVNGTEVSAFPTQSNRWYDVKVQNNIIANNVAGWDGAGISLEDSLKVTVVNNTIASNDTTASAGVLFKTLGAIDASSPPPGCTPVTDPTQPQNPNCLGHDAAHIPQPAGLVTMKNTPNLVDALTGVNVTCPSGFGYTGGTGPGSLRNANCRSLSLPVLTNDLFWQNRAFHVEISGPGAGNQSQQNLVALVPQLNQATTGFCAPSGTDKTGTGTVATNYWDVGVRDDVVPNDGVGGAKLSLNNSILTPLTGVTYGGSNNLYPNPATPPVIAQYCNGARVPPENGGHGYQAPPGRSETTGLSPVFVFNNITPSATVDEGNNWINLTYGPLTLYSDAGKAMLAGSPNGPTLGAYSIGSGSAAKNAGSNNDAPATDFFGNPRARTNSDKADIGAVEFTAANVAVPVVTPAPLAFGQVLVGATSTKDLTLTNNGGAAFTVTSITIASTPAFSRVNTGTFPAGAPNCGLTVAAGASCTIRVQYTAQSPANTASSGTATISGNAAVTNSPVTLTGSSAAPTFLATVSPSPLAFGNWATGTISSTQNLTVTNTGNSGLTGLTYTIGGATPQPFTRVTTGTFPGGAPNCVATLAVGAACTVKVQFAPTTATAFSRTLTVAGTGATVTPTPVTLTGTGVSARATVLISPNPLTINASNLVLGVPTGTGVVTLTNTAPAGTGAQMTVSGVAITAGNALVNGFVVGALAGPDNCTGITLAAGAQCTVTVRYTSLTRPASNRNGTITFTDNASTPSQNGALIGTQP